LELVSNFLIEKKLKFLHVQYKGSMRIAQREKAVKVFQDRNKARVMLMSAKCGGVGLNLTRGNRACCLSSHWTGAKLLADACTAGMICMDLAWSEAVENQAWSRVHRIGQKREVFVERFVIADTVEERILLLQERKKAVADGALGEGGGEKLGRLSVKELANCAYLLPRLCVCACAD
jgi:SNF2 family DNA or RNA helicase